MISELNRMLFENHQQEASNQPSLYGPTINISERGELLDYLREKKKNHKTVHVETPLLNIYMKNLRLQEYQGKTNKYDLSLSKKSPMGASKKILTGGSVEKKHSLKEDGKLNFFGKI